MPYEAGFCFVFALSSPAHDFFSNNINYLSLSPEVEKLGLILYHVLPVLQPPALNLAAELSKNKNLRNLFHSEPQHMMRGAATQRLVLQPRQHSRRCCLVKAQCTLLRVMTCDSRFV
jgi:hypothetical protein